MSDIPVVICTVCSNQMIDNRHLNAENAQLRKRVEAMEILFREAYGELYRIHRLGDFDEWVLVERMRVVLKEIRGAAS